MCPLQKLTTEHTEHAERVKFMNKRIIFGHWVHVSMFNERLKLSLVSVISVVSVVRRSPFCSEFKGDWRKMNRAFPKYRCLHRAKRSLERQLHYPISNARRPNPLIRPQATASAAMTNGASSTVDISAISSAIVVSSSRKRKTR